MAIVIPPSRQPPSSWLVLFTLLCRWRLPTFEAGKCVLAFDGAALLLLELSRRHRERASLP